jgi:putative endonuclease
MQTTRLGQQAEEAAAEFLRQRGYVILRRNWRHRRAEIDIIASKENTVFFVEVKYRRRSLFGRGFDYVTAAKQRQMGFAADLWLVEHRWYGMYRLAAIEVSGPQFAVTGFIDSVY